MIRDKSYAPDLSGVPETMLWPLWNRAVEQKRDQPLVVDPLAAALADRIDYDYAESFGKPNAGHAMRARVFDDAVKAWLKEHPDGYVVSLGEGLDTQFWRVDNKRLHWLSVDVEESAKIRADLLPKDERMQTFACSALDHAWMKQVPEGQPAFVLMAGLLMYFKEQEVFGLISSMAETFPAGTEFIFDAVPPWLANLSMRSKGLNITKTYIVPRSPWGMTFRDVYKIANLHPQLRIKQKLTFADPYPDRMKPFSWFSFIACVRNNFASWMLHLECI